MILDEVFDADEIFREALPEDSQEVLDEDETEEIDFDRGHARLLEEQHDMFEEY